VSAETETVMEGDSVTLHTNLSEILNDDTILWLFGPKESLKTLDLSPSETSESDTRDNINSPSLEK